MKIRYITTNPKLKQMLLLPAVALAAMGLTVPSAKAAFINIDDSDLDTVTITAGDFEGGFYLNGDLFTSGFGFNSVTLPDGSYTFTGNWIDLGMADGTSLGFLFAHPDDPAFVTSGVEASAEAGEEFASMTGFFGGYTGTPYFTTASPTLNQFTSGPQEGFLPFVQFNFTPEAASVPDAGSTFALLGVGIAGLRLFRRKV